MKKTFLLIALGATGQLFAQSNWTKIGPPPPAIQVLDEFVQVSGSAHAFADVDNDGDQDVMISGHTISNGFLTILYINDGTGAFVQNPSSFPGMYYPEITFGDLDNDGDQDVVLAGSGITAMYQNDGTGMFTIGGYPFPAVSSGTVKIVDVDSDSNPDVFVGGLSGSDIANLYWNDGTANFTLAATFPGIYFGSAEFGDVDNDGDLDFIQMGYGNSGSHSELFINQGNAIFTLASSNFPTLNSGDIAFSDVDGDSDLDVVISGEDPGVGGLTALYLNDGTGAFTVSSSSNFLQTTAASLDFGDIDGDGDDDLLISGNTSTVGTATKLYENDGNGVFTLIPGISLNGVSFGSSTLTDIDGDSDLDIFVTGNYQAVMYLNDGDGNYSTLPTSPFPGSQSGAIVFADVDADDDLDIVITGQEQSVPSTKLYLNDGTGGYTYDNTNSFPNVANSAADFADIDNDGDDDLLVSGYGNGQATRLFTNDGTGVFTLATSPFPNVSSGDIEFHDVDSDGDQDVVISGFNNTGNVGQLWMNDGTGNFSFAGHLGRANNGNIAFADIDNDSDDDVLMTGYGDNGQMAELYTNNGSGIFTLVASPFQGVQQGAIDFADIDGDGDQDLVIAGQIETGDYIAELYTNDGTGTFSLVPGTPFAPSITSGLIFSDIDNDLDPDLMTIGSSAQCFAQLFANDGTGVFTFVSGTPFESASQGMMAFGDIDGDNDPDLVIAGNNCTTGIETNIYRNNNCQQSNSIDVHVSCTAFTWIDGIEYTESNHTASMTYPNAAGCDSVVVLHLTIGDSDGAPDLAVLPNVMAECEVMNLTAPTATMNCTGTITGTTNQAFPISAQDTTEVVWTFTAPNGFEITQTQLVIIHDTTAPVPDMATLPTAMSPCPFITLGIIPTATDNCGGTIQGTSTDLPVATPGTTIITWTFTDASGNSTTQTEELIYTPWSNEVTYDGTTLTATQSFGQFQWYDCNAEAIIPGATSQTYTPTANGSYSITIANFECSVTSDCFEVTGLGVNEQELSNISIYPNPNAGSFTLVTSKAVSILIFNTAGQLVHAEELQSGKSEMNLKELESGVYLVHSVHANGSRTIQKVSIVK